MSLVNRHGRVSAALAILLVVLLPSVSLSAAWTLLAGKTITAGADVSDLTTADFDNDNALDIICVNHHNNGTLTFLTGRGDATFEKKLVHKLAHDPIAIESADFNKDGNMDIVMANWDDSTISVMLGRGDKTFDDPVDYTTDVEPVDIETADMNNDGIADIVVACLDGGAVDVFLGVGDGSFIPLSGVSGGAMIRSLTAGDLDGDGDTDIACTNWDDNTITILAGDGSGGLTFAKSIKTGTRPWTVEAADFDVDGAPDLAVSNAADDTVYIFMNSASKFDNFTSVVAEPTTVLDTDNGPAAVKAALMNNDRYPDLLVTDTLDNHLSVYLGRGNGLFDLYSLFYTTLYPASAVAADFDGDLLNDDAIGVFTSGVVSPNKGHLDIQGRWSFQPYTTAAPPSYSAGLTPSYLTTGDFNADTRPDIIAADSGTGRSILPGDGYGALGAASVYTDSVIHTPTCSPNVDLNGDLRLDYATAVFTTATSAGAVEVRYRQADGTLGAPVDYPVGVGPDCVYAVDLNKDGSTDLVTTNSVGVVPEGGTDPVYTISVLINNTVGGFQAAANYDLIGRPVSISFGDTGTDGYPDVIISMLVEGAPDEVEVLRNTSGNGFASIVDYIVGENPGHVLVFDVNRDGKNDLIVPDTDDDNLFPLISDSTDLLVPQQPLLTGPAPVYVIACDLDMNGLPDLAVANTGDNTVSVILGREKSTLGVAVNPADLSMGSVAVDLDGSPVPDPNGEFDTGLLFTLTATPTPGHTFTGWSGDIKGSTNPLGLVLAGDKSVTANFAVGPYVTGITPDNGVMDDVVTIDGTNFGTSGSVTMGGKGVKNVIWSDTQITFTVPPKLPYGAKTVSIRNGDLGTIGNVTFTINRASISGITPSNAAPGSAITIDGADFGTRKLKAYFYGTDGTRKGAKVTVFTGTSATLTVPKLPPGVYGVTVKNKHGESLKTSFTVDPIP